MELITNRYHKVKYHFTLSSLCVAPHTLNVVHRPPRYIATCYLFDVQSTYSFSSTWQARDVWPPRLVFMAFRDATHFQNLLQVCLSWRSARKSSIFSFNFFQIPFFYISFYTIFFICCCIYAVLWMLNIDADIGGARSTHPSSLSSRPLARPDHIRVYASLAPYDRPLGWCTV